MQTMIENALKATMNAKAQIEMIRQRFQHPQEEFGMADDAVLGVGWAIKRLNDLDATFREKSSTTS
jgi:hypothetical protein